MQQSPLLSHSVQSTLCMVPSMENTDVETVEVTQSAPREQEMEIEKEQTASSPSPSAKQEIASIREVFCFARTPRTRLCIGLAFCCAIVSGSVFPAMAFYFATAFEDLGADTESDDFMDTIRSLAITFMILGLIVLVFMTLQSALMETAAGHMTRAMQSAWFEALLRQDMAYYDVNDMAGQAIILSTNGAKYKKGVGRKLAESVQFFTTFCGAMVYAFYADWRTSLAVLAVAPFMILSVLFLLKMNTSQTARANATYAKAGSIVSTAVSSIRTVLALNAVEKVIDLYQSATTEAYEGAVSEVWLVGLANGSNMASFLLSYVVVTLLGSYLLYDNVRDTGCDPSGTVDGVPTCDPAGVDVFGSLLAITFAAGVLPQVSVCVEAFIGARVACYPAILAMNRTVESDTRSSTGGGSGSCPRYIIDTSSDKGKRPSSVAGDILFRNIRFAYPARPGVDVFKDFSLKIEAGKTIALVGASGEGKSTTVGLMERFYDPDFGSVLLDGIDLRDLNVKWLRQQIGLVSQEPKLFATSIRENIASGAPNFVATDEQIEEAARIANAHDFIVSFPDGYNTQAGDMGTQLSGGQKQRIALARVLIKKPKVLLLDEATSALDTESERVVQNALDGLMELKSMTIFVIAHRLSTVRNADAIAVINDGQIVETGTHDELLAKKCFYYDLVEAQHLRASVPEADSEPPSEHEGRRESTMDPIVHAEMSGTPVIRFRGVHFCYPSRPNNIVFNGLSLAIRHGETLALCGPSGCGKSSTVALIECFYRPTGGIIEYHGVDMKEINIKWLRGSQLGLVSQEPVLFDTTILENIRFGTDATQEEVEDAARKANCHDFIVTFPDGYQTQVGQGSNLVSGGQKQRIAIARALLKKPKVLLLDEATSAMDSKSEQIVQQTLDTIMSNPQQTCIVIAHRLSTIRNADRIAVIDKGTVREIGTHEELMGNPNGRYRRLQAMQNLHSQEEYDSKSTGLAMEDNAIELIELSKPVEKRADDDGDDGETELEVDEQRASENAKRARLLASSDKFYFLVGGIGAIFFGLMFPSWGFVFAYMIEILYTTVEDCPPVPDGVFGDCDAYWKFVADDMQDQSLRIFYAFLGVIAATLLGSTLLFWGFGVASERMNKRVRDSAFTSLLRQEIAWFDVRSPGTITSHLAADAALLHAFSGEPIRTLVLNLSSVLIGVIVSFVYMWPFALLTLAILPFMGFGAEMEMKMYMGADEGDDKHIDEHSPGGIVIETLSNIRTVASLTLEEKRAAEYLQALVDEDPHPIRANVVKGSAAGLGQFVQMWGMALMFFWGGWLLHKYPSTFSYREFLISMFALLFSLYGLAIAAQGAVNRDKAVAAADRIFTLIDRKSQIDPLSDLGKKDF